MFRRKPLGFILVDDTKDELLISEKTADEDEKDSSEEETVEVEKEELRYPIAETPQEKEDPESEEKPWGKVDY